jgi:hypothetical protein
VLQRASWARSPHPTSAPAPSREPSSEQRVPASKGAASSEQEQPSSQLSAFSSTSQPPTTNPNNRHPGGSACWRLALALALLALGARARRARRPTPTPNKPEPRTKSQRANETKAEGRGSRGCNYTRPFGLKPRDMKWRSGHWPVEVVSKARKSHYSIIGPPNCALSFFYPAVGWIHSPTFP